MLEDKIIILDSLADTREMGLNELAHRLVDTGAVKETFPDAILSREVEFPTGLQTENLGVAIPHTDAKYVNKNQMAVLRFANPVEFLQMGDGQPIRVNILFMLALKEPHAQLEMLQKLVALIQDEEIAKRLLNNKTPSQIVETLNAAGIE
ncbi:PTS sugar transporter subunit IIA [Weissella soli]|uniref:PTS sugar transporter subunit IIA n=2 Tax=Weissella soli TaxID=155866 RepID=UPI003C7370AD